MAGRSALGMPLPSVCHPEIGQTGNGRISVAAKFLTASAFGRRHRRVKWRKLSRKRPGSLPLWNRPLFRTARKKVARPQPAHERSKRHLKSQTPAPRSYQALQIGPASVFCNRARFPCHHQLLFPDIERLAGYGRKIAVLPPVACLVEFELGVEALGMTERIDGSHCCGSIPIHFENHHGKHENRTGALVEFESRVTAFGYEYMSCWIPREHVRDGSTRLCGSARPRKREVPA